MFSDDHTSSSRMLAQQGKETSNATDKPIPNELIYHSLESNLAVAATPHLKMQRTLKQIQLKTLPSTPCWLWIWDAGTSSAIVLSVQKGP